MVKQDAKSAKLAKGVKKEGNSISKKVGWINKNVMLAQSISWRDVSEGLEQIGEQAASELLDELSGKALAIKEPTGWLLKAIENGGVAKTGKGAGDSSEKAPMRGIRKVSKTIGWMNKQGELQQPINFKEVGGLLTSIGDRQAGALLYELDQKKDSIRDPTQWLKSAAMRQAGLGDFNFMSMMGSKGYGKGFGTGGTNISKYVGYLNKSLGLETTISYRDVVGPLTAMGEGPANKLLEEFEEKHASIQDPTNWIVAAANRKSGGRGNKGWSNSGNSTSKSGGNSISKSVGRLNKSLNLETTISYKDVIEPLTEIGEEAACELLKEFEKKHATIKDPTKWIISAAKRMVE